MKKVLLPSLLALLIISGCWNSKLEEENLVFEKKTECASLVDNCPQQGPNSDSCSNGTFYSTYYNSCMCEMYCSNPDYKFEYLLYDLFSNRYIVDCYGAALANTDFVEVFDEKLSKKVKYSEGWCHDVLQSFIDYVK